MNVLLTTICPGKADIQLALYYLKAYCEKHSFICKAKGKGQRAKSKVKIVIQVFAANEKIDTIIACINKQKPNIIGFSCYLWNIKNILKVAKELKCKNAKLKIIFGGPEVSSTAKALLSSHSSIDIVVRGEGEITFKEIVEHYAQEDSNLAQVNGIAYREGDKIIETPKRPGIPNLDLIPSPYLEGTIDMDFNKYEDYLPTETLRGCAFKCHYCYYHKEFKGLRYLSLERVERELKYLLKKNPKGIYLMDPTFNMNKQRAKDILRIFIKYNKKSHLHVELKAEFLDKEMVDLLYKAKANFIEIGIQSTNPKTLKAINRHFQPDAFKRGILLLNRKKIDYEIQLIDGLPQDNYKTIKDSIDWLMALHPSEIRILRLMLLPGTYLRDNARNFGIRYNHRPPYYSFRSNTFSPSDLNKTNILRNAMAMLYDWGLLRKGIYFIKRDLNLGYSKIFEEYYKWMQRNHSKLLNLNGKRNHRPQNSLKIESTIKKVRLIKILQNLEPFTEYLYKKYKHLKVTNHILRTIKQDKKQFLARNAIECSKLS